MAWLSYIGVGLAVLKDVVLNALKHRATLKELEKKAQIEAAKTKTELLKADKVQDTAFINSSLSPTLGDKVVRRGLLIAVFMPFLMCMVDLFGYPQYGSEIVNKYFTTITSVLPVEYIIFVTSMVSGYFGIVKVREFFKK
jgi:hypothetical protein